MANLRPTTINDTGFIKFPNGTGPERTVPGSPNPNNGYMRFNTSTGKLEAFGISNWIDTTRPRDPVITRGLIIWLDPGDPASYPGAGTTYLDISGNNNHATIPESGVTYNGLHGGSLTFNGTSRVEVSHTTTLDRTGTQTYTVSAWIYPTAGSGTWGGIVSKGNGQQYAMTFNKLSNYIHYESNTSGIGPLDTGVGSVPYNRWSQITIVYNQSTKRTFINGEVAATQTTTGYNSASNTENLRIGEGNNGEGFQGSIGPVLMYSRALTDNEIRQNYRASAKRFAGFNLLGSIANPAPSAQVILEEYGSMADGGYYINLPTVGSRLTFCLMNTAAAGQGAYMLAMKATRGNTFNYNSNFWTSANTLNDTVMNRNDGDAKYDVFNYFTASEFVAFFPDLNNGGQTSGFGTGWHWRQGNQSRTALNRFQTYEILSNNPRGESMYVGSGFSNQLGFQQYAFNYTGNAGNATRWGFGWNNEGDQASNDVTSGIAPVRAGTSAGDHIFCCQGTTGVNRSVRFEIWVR